MAELRPYEPTWRDRLASALLGDGRSSGRQQFVEGLLGSRGLGQTGIGLVDLTPAGVPLAVQESRQAFEQGSPAAGLLGAMAVLPAAKPAALAAQNKLASVSQSLENTYPGLKLDISGGGGRPVVVHRIEVPKELRSQGIGTSVMRDIINYADDAGEIVALSPSSDFGGSKSRLIDWYSSLGFTQNKGRSKDLSISESMYRLPNVSND